MRELPRSSPIAGYMSSPNTAIIQRTRLKSEYVKLKLKEKPNKIGKMEKKIDSRA